eukprot:2622802-Pleurochrysis_carterae.AAC.2
MSCRGIQAPACRRGVHDRAAAAPVSACRNLESSQAARTRRLSGDSPSTTAEAAPAQLPRPCAWSALQAVGSLSRRREHRAAAAPPWLSCPPSRQA